MKILIQFNFNRRSSMTAFSFSFFLSKFSVKKLCGVSVISQFTWKPRKRERKGAGKSKLLFFVMVTYGRSFSVGFVKISWPAEEGLN